MHFVSLWSYAFEGSMDPAAFLQKSFLLLILTMLASCAREQKQTDLVTFNLRGQVISIDHTRHRIVIDHEEIPNYMMAMTMPFKVKDTTLLYNVEPGDSVQGTLAVSRSESWLETLAVIGQGAPPPEVTAEDIMFRRVYKTGDLLPDFSFVNQQGTRIRFSDYHGKVVAITFIYSRCPLPDFCIRMSNYFAQIQKALSRDRSLEGRWHLITISFDPKFDTPAVLQAYGRSYNADFKTWDFATDSMKSIQKIADGLGLVQQDDEGGLISHNLRTAVLDSQGRLADVLIGNEWKPKELEEMIRAAIKKTAS